MHQSTIKASALKALADILPIIASFLVMGAGYGLYMHSLGFSWIWPLCTSAIIFAGSMEFLVATMLISTFNPLLAVLMTIVVNGRHLFYGLSILVPYQHAGWKRPFLITFMCDEAFSVNYMYRPIPGIDTHWYMFFVSVILYASWICGSLMGALSGSLPFIESLRGVEFVMPAMFICIFVSNWQKETSHGASLMGIGVTLLCLFVFGDQYFLLPTLLIISLIFIVRWSTYKDKEALL